MTKATSTKSKRLQHPVHRGTGKTQPTTGTGPQSSPAKTRPRSRRSVAAAPARKRGDAGKIKQTKQQICLDHLQKPDGATIAQLQRATGWQAHSVRGFLSGTVKKKLGLRLVSEASAGAPRRYRVVPTRV